MSSLSDSVVLITAKNPKVDKFGTGFVIYRDDAKQVSYLLTCQHVLTTIRDKGEETYVKVDEQYYLVEEVKPSQKHGFDLAIVKVEKLVEIPPVRLVIHDQDKAEIEVVGHQSFSKTSYLLRKLKGHLIRQTRVTSKEETISAQTWDFEVDDEEDTLEPGYSGGPIAYRNSSEVLGVAATRIRSNPTKGIAISIENLKHIWPSELPAHLCPDLVEEEEEEEEEEKEEEEKETESSPLSDGSEQDLKILKYSYGKYEKAYRIFISYAYKNHTFVRRLAVDLKEMGFDVWYEEKTHPDENREGYLRHQMANWADFCIFVVCQDFDDFDKPSDPSHPDHYLPKEMEWAKVRASQLHRPFKRFWVMVETCQVSIELRSLPGADFIGWQQTVRYQLGLRRLFHHLHHHRYDPDLFVDRELECERCAYYLLYDERPTAGVLICNKDGTRGLGNSMLLWYLGEVYLPSILSESCAIIHLDWAELGQSSNMGPVEWMRYVRVLLADRVDFADFDKKWQSIKAGAGKLNKRQTQQRKRRKGPALRFNPQMRGVLSQNQGRMRGSLSRVDHLPFSLSHQKLMELTKEFLKALQNGECEAIVCLVNGPSGSEWNQVLGHIAYNWLTETFDQLKNIDNVWMVLAGTYPLLDNYPDVIKLDRLNSVDIQRYVDKRLGPFMRDPLSKDLITKRLWDETQGHPGKMFEQLENMLAELFGRAR